MPPIAAAIDAFADHMEAINGFQHHAARAFERLDQMIALHIDVACDVMRDLPCRVTQSDPLIERRSSRPERAAVLIDFRRLPKPHMMPLPRVISHRLLE